MSEDLVDALKAHRAADDEVAFTLRRDYPVNHAVRWMRGAGRHAGIVTRHSYGNRIQVRNDLTGKVYWISASDIARSTDSSY